MHEIALKQLTQRICQTNKCHSKQLSNSYNWYKLSVRSKTMEWGEPLYSLIEYDLPLILNGQNLIDIDWVKTSISLILIDINFLYHWLRPKVADKCTIQEIDVTTDRPNAAWHNAQGWDKFWLKLIHWNQLILLGIELKCVCLNKK